MDMEGWKMDTSIYLITKDVTIAPYSKNEQLVKFIFLLKDKTL